MPDKIVAVIQARMGSSRLPGKVLLNILGKPVLWHIVNRLSKAKGIDQIVIATSDKTQDDEIEKFCKQYNFDIFRGDEIDVLDRFFKASQKYKADSVIRVTGDCPLVDPQIVGALIKLFQDNNYDHCGVATGAGVSGLQNIKKFPDGMDAEIMKFEALSVAHAEANTELHREHVTPFIWQQPERFNLGALYPKGRDYSQYRLTLDQREDFEVIKQIFGKLWHNSPDFGLDEIIDLMDGRPELNYGNQQFIGKEGYEQFR